MIYERRTQKRDSMSFKEQTEMIMGSVSLSANTTSTTDSISTLLEKAAAGEIDTVIISDVDHLCASTDEVKEILSKLEDYGVQVIAMDEEDVTARADMIEK